MTTQNLQKKAIKVCFPLARIFVHYTSGLYKLVIILIYSIDT